MKTVGEASGNQSVRPKIFTLHNVGFFLLGCVFYAVGVGFFLTPNHIVPGGVYGSSILINSLFGGEKQSSGFMGWLMSVSTLTVIINIPILAVGVWKLKLRFLLSTICAIIVQNSLLYLIEFLINFFEKRGYDIIPVKDNVLLSAITGGVLVGVCIGLLFRVGATCGGSDVVVKLLRLRFRYMKTGMVFMILDGTIVALSAFALGIEAALYGGIALFVQSMVLNFVLYGGDSARLVYVISDKPEIIATQIMRLIIGITYLSGEGAYSHKGKKVIMCVVRKRQLPQVRSIVKENDTNAFMIVTSANQVLGRGFKNINEEEL